MSVLMFTAVVYCVVGVQVFAVSTHQKVLLHPTPDPSEQLTVMLMYALGAGSPNVYAQPWAFLGIAVVVGPVLSILRVWVSETMFRPPMLLKDGSVVYAVT